MILIGEIFGLLKLKVTYVYAKTFSQPKSNPPTKKRTSNTSQHKPTQENPAQTHKSPRADKTTRTNQNKAVSTQQPPKTSRTDTAPPTHHPMVDTRSTRANAPPPPAPTHDNYPEHTATLPTLTQENPHAPTQKKQGRARPNQSRVDHQKANGRHRAYTENPRKLPRRHNPAPTGIRCLLLIFWVAEPKLMARFSLKNYLIMIMLST